MAAVVTDIINAVTKMIKALESEGAALVSKMAEFATQAAITLEQILKDAFEKVKRTLAGIGRAFKAKLKALEDRKRPTPNGGTGFIEKLKGEAAKVGKEMELVIKKFSEGVKAITSRVKEVIVKLKTIVEAAAADVGKFLADAEKEFFKAVKTISTKAMTEAKSIAEDLNPTHAMDGAFSHVHNLEMAAGTSIALFDPVLIGSFILSAGIIAGASSYKA